MKTAGLRKQIRELSDELTPNDAQYHLCRHTGLSYREILSKMAEVSGGRDRCYKALNVGSRDFYSDDGWFAMLAQWIKMYVPQWEARFRKAMSDIEDSKDLVATDEIVARAATALNLPVELFHFYADNAAELETFLEAHRRTLGVMAEMELWKLVGAGDAATIRWVLGKVKKDVFGDLRTPDEDKGNKGPRTITIIDQEPDV